MPKEKTKYVLVYDDEVVPTIFDSMDEARDYIADEYEDEETDVTLYALGQEYEVIKPSKKVLFKKKSSE